MSPDCQRKNLRPLTMVAVGVNKAAEQYMLLDERTKEDLASGKYHDQRRGTYGSTAASDRPDAPAGPKAAEPRAPAGPGAPAAAGTAAAAGAPAGAGTAAAAGAPTGARRPAPAAKRRPPSPPRPAGSTPQRLPWSRSQQKLALLYNEQGLRPDEIAAKIGLSRYLVTKIILSARNGGKI
jgi:hypothetical protein